MIYLRIEDLLQSSYLDLSREIFNYLACLSSTERCKTSA